MWGKFTLITIVITFCTHLVKCQSQNQTNSTFEKTYSPSLLKNSTLDYDSEFFNGDIHDDVDGGGDRKTFKRGVRVNKRKRKPVQLRKIQEMNGAEFFKRFKLKKKTTAEFVSLRCGIGSHWDAATKKCDPHNHDSVEEPEPVLGESDEELLKKPESHPANGQSKGSGSGSGSGYGSGSGGGGGGGGSGSGNGGKSGNHKQLPTEEPSEEVIVGHIVAIHCGIGFKYDKNEKKCSPLAPLPDQKFPQKITKSDMKVLKKAEKKATSNIKPKKNIKGKTTKVDKSNKDSKTKI